MRFHTIYRALRGGWTAPRTLATLALALAGFAIAPAAAQNWPASFSVDVGYEDTVQAIEAEAFFPNSLTVNVGDSVTFTMRSHEAHTISFNSPQPIPGPFLPEADRGLVANPIIFLPTPQSRPGAPDAPVNLNSSFDGKSFLNSGLFQKPDDSLTVKFRVPGTYVALCMIHPESMKVTIVVKPAGSARSMSDADYRAAAASQLKDTRAKADALLKAVAVPPPVTNADGTRIYRVMAGAGDAKTGIDLMRYIGGELLQIKAGDTVVFDMGKNHDGVPHTVTFLSGDDDPSLITPVAQAGGPPKLLVNPKVLMPAPLPPGPFDGSAFTNSGLLMKAGPTPQTFEVTFVKAGTFKYQCILHDEDGMQGTIIVQKRGEGSMASTRGN
jgi:plastocyanin